MMKNSRGISLTEVMIAMLIGLFLLAGVAQVFFATKRSFTHETQVSSNESEARFLIYYLERMVRIAGYRAEPSSNEKFPDFSALYTSVSPHVSATSATGFNSSDSFTVRFQGSTDGTITDCLGDTVGNSDIAVNTFSINGSGQLECRAVNPTAGTDTTEVITDNIEIMRVRLGEDTDGDGIANRYVTPDYSGLNNTNVVSIRISFVIATANNTGGIDDTSTYNVLGYVYNPANDTRTRRLHTQTIYMRNVPTNNLL